MQLLTCARSAERKTPLLFHSPAGSSVTRGRGTIYIYGAPCFCTFNHLDNSATFDFSRRFATVAPCVSGVIGRAFGRPCAGFRNLRQRDANVRRCGVPSCCIRIRGGLRTMPFRMLGRTPGGREGPGRPAMFCVLIGPSFLLWRTRRFGHYRLEHYWFGHYHFAHYRFLFWLVRLAHYRITAHYRVLLVNRHTRAHARV